jgi:SOS response regulatory protein OraA/RecX
MTPLIDIQDAYIARVMAAYAKVTPRTKGNRFGRAKRAARKHTITRLIRRGYSAEDAAQIVNDAHDVFLLEAAATSDAS